MTLITQYRISKSSILIKFSSLFEHRINFPKNSISANTAIVVAAESGQISGSKAKEIFEKHLTSDIDLAAEIAANQQTSDTGAIEAEIAKILTANADKVEQYKGGKEALFGFFVGQTMKAMQGKANPQVVNELLKKALA